MSNTIHFQNTDTAQEEAAKWLAAIDRGLTELERDELDSWLSKSPLNGEALVAFAASWDKMDMLSAVKKILPLNSLETPTEPQIAHQSKRTVYWLSAGVAAAVVLAFVIALPFFQQSEPSSEPYFSAVYETIVGNQKEIQLPDGSTLKINTNTEVHISYSEESRSVYLLRGEAYFDVAKNPTVPFVAFINRKKVVAVGTEFNIQRINKSDFEVLVTEGRVRVETDSIDSSTDIENDEKLLTSEPITLSVGERVKVNREIVQRRVEKLSNEHIDSDLAWRNGLIVFEGQTLETAIAEISRYTAIDISIEDDSIRNIEVGGYFKAGDTDQLLYILQQNFGIGFRQEGNTILLASITSSN